MANSVEKLRALRPQLGTVLDQTKDGLLRGGGLAGKTMAVAITMMRPVLEGKADDALAAGDPDSFDELLERGIDRLARLRSDDRADLTVTSAGIAGTEWLDYSAPDSVAGPGAGDGRLGDREEPSGESALSERAAW